MKLVLVSSCRVCNYIVSAKWQETENFENEKSAFRDFAIPLIEKGVAVFWVGEQTAMSRIKREAFWCKCHETINEKVEKELKNKRRFMGDAIIMKTLKELTTKVDNANKEICLAKDEIFKNYRDYILWRLQRVCVNMVIGRKDPATCGEEYSIPFGIAKSQVEHIKVGTCGDYVIDFKNGEIIICVETTFQGETDSAFRFKFPVDDKEFEAYLLQLKQDGCERLRLIEAKEEQLYLLQEQREKKELARLQEKYLNK